MPRTMVAVLAVLIILAAAGGLFLWQWTGRSPAPQSTIPSLRAEDKSSDNSATFAEASSSPLRILFDDDKALSGIEFTHVPTRSSDKYLPEIMGGGVAVADFNRDGAPDLLFVNSGDLNATTRPEAARNRLFMNDGHGRFVDGSDAWGLPSEGYGMGVAVGDFDNDGWPDVFLTAYGRGEMLLRNTGSRFENVTAAAHIEPDGKWSTSAGFFDYDLDGDLDLYIVRYVEYELATATKCYLRERHIYCTPLLFDAVPDRLLENNGDGTFAEVSSLLQLDTTPGKGLAVVLGDVNQDGLLDAYVGNDSTRNLLYVGDGNGSFREVGRLAGVAYSEEGREEAGMGVDIADVNGDGLTDITCTNFQGETTSLYQQLRPLVFQERSDAAGIGRSARMRLSFGVDFFDVDNDGDEDLLVGNGHIDDEIDRYSDTIRFGQQNTLYVNDGEGAFTDESMRCGPALSRRSVTRGVASGDLDGDGLLDYIAVNNGSLAQVAFNQTEGSGNAVILWLEGLQANRSAIGARVSAQVGDRIIERQVLGASSYLSACDLRVHIGIGEAAQIDSLTIYWPGSAPQVIGELKAGSFYHIVEGKAAEEFVPGERIIAPR